MGKGLAQAWAYDRYDQEEGDHQKAVKPDCVTAGALVSGHLARSFSMASASL
jgi:hypothetical protein